MTDPVLPGQESVWSYPRPAIAQPTAAHLRVELGGRVVAETRHGVRTLETSHPPSYYFPREDIAPGCLRTISRRSVCEWMGEAEYFDVVAGDRVAEAAGWSYPHPSPAFLPLAGFVAFYPGPMDACWVDGERVVPQPGRFYGGWITSRVAGPFKGGPGTAGW